MAKMHLKWNETRTGGGRVAVLHDVDTGAVRAIAARMARKVWNIHVGEEDRAEWWTLKHAKHAAEQTVREQWPDAQVFIDGEGPLKSVKKA